MGGSLRCNRMGLYQLHLGYRLVANPMGVVVQMDNPCQQSCNSKVSWRLSSPSPIALAIRCNQHCNQMGKEM